MQWYVLPWTHAWMRYFHHYSDVIISTMASQITSLTIVYSTVYSGADHRKHQSSASLAFVRGIYRWPVNSSHKRPVTRKMSVFDDVIMIQAKWVHLRNLRHRIMIWTVLFQSYHNTSIQTHRSQRPHCHTHVHTHTNTLARASDSIQCTQYLAVTFRQRTQARKNTPTARP